MGTIVGYLVMSEDQTEPWDTRWPNHAMVCAQPDWALYRGSYASCFQTRAQAQAAIRRTLAVIAKENLRWCLDYRIYPLRYYGKPIASGRAPKVARKVAGSSRRRKG